MQKGSVLGECKKPNSPMRGYLHRGLGKRQDPGLAHITRRYTKTFIIIKKNVWMNEENSELKMFSVVAQFRASPRRGRLKSLL